MLYDSEVRNTDNRGRAGGVRAEGLGKRFGELGPCAASISEAPAGTVLGLLGHNGAGKTTALRILTTLAAPTEGRAWVAGHDVVTEAAKVRARIGVASQAATVDGLLTRAREPGDDRTPVPPAPRGGPAPRRRAARAGRRWRTRPTSWRRTSPAACAAGSTSPRRWSRRRRCCSWTSPRPGSIPTSRNQLWELLREHVRDGATLVLTTQYLEEADRLATDIVVLDHGRIAAHGTPAAAQGTPGRRALRGHLVDPGQLEAARARLGAYSHGEVTVDADARQRGRRAPAGTRLVEVVRALDADGIDAHDVHRREVTLDDVFLSAHRDARRPPRRRPPDHETPHR